MFPREDQAAQTGTAGFAGRRGQAIGTARKRDGIDRHQPESQSGGSLSGQGRPAGPGGARELDHDRQSDLAARAEPVDEADDLLECLGMQDGAGRGHDNAPGRPGPPVGVRGRGVGGGAAGPGQSAHEQRVRLPAGRAGEGVASWRDRLREQPPQQRRVWSRGRPRRPEQRRREGGGWLGALSDVKQVAEDAGDRRVKGGRGGELEQPASTGERPSVRTR